MNNRQNQIVAVIPIREGSARIKDKNFVPFGGHPTLLHNKVEQLKASGSFDRIYISSDSQKARQISKECRVEYLFRDPAMCTNRPRWDEVIEAIVKTIPGDPHVAWAMVTSPLFVRYKDAVKEYMNHLNINDSLVGVKQIREYLIDEMGRPLFYSFGVWHPYSNELKPIYAINDAIFIAKKSDQLHWRYWIGRKPYLFQCNPIESIDINFPEDLKMAILAKDMMEG